MCNFILFHFISLGTSKPGKKNKYYGSYPSPYGLGHGGGIGHAGNSFLGKHGSSPSMYTIFPYMVAKKAHKIHRPRFGSMPLFISRPHYHHYHHYRHHGFDGGINPEHSSYFDVYNDNYGKLFLIYTSYKIISTLNTYTVGKTNQYTLIIPHFLKNNFASPR